jgi:CRISPR/Cas system CSM-associated protein Csm3 (group 7 of RAMP superfamily)
MKPRADRVQIEYQLDFAMPFHFGTGMRVGLIDRAVLRDSNRYLYVPGSTIKGVVREHCEQLARFLGAEDSERLRIGSPHVTRDAQAALQGYGEKVPIITRIFGSQAYAGRLFFEDARQIEPEFWDGKDIISEPEDKGKYSSLQVDVSTQVRLDRLTRTAVQHALYTSEFGIRDLQFKGCIRGVLECFPLPLEQTARETPTYSLLLLLAGLLMVERMGANKSSGKGKCSFKITQLTIGDTTYDEGEWQSWMDQLESLAFYKYTEE